MDYSLMEVCGPIMWTLKLPDDILLNKQLFEKDKSVDLRP